MRVALVHDYLNEFGGAERVLLALSEIWPKAPIYTAFYKEGSAAYERFRDKQSFSSNKKIITSWAQKVPLFSAYLHSPLRFLAPLIWNSFDFSDFDVVVTSSSWYVTKGVVKRLTTNDKRKPIEICYCHTPPRYLYGYPTSIEWQRYWPFRFYGLFVNHFMRVYDFEAAQRVDYFIANSKEVAARIKKFYRRESVVIYPPVDTSDGGRLSLRSHDSSEVAKGGYFLVVSRLVASKNVDVAVEVCAKLGLPLKVVGTGREMERLKKLTQNSFDYSSSLSTNARGTLSREVITSSSRQAPPKTGQARTINSSIIEFLGDVNDDELIDLYQNCRAVIFAAAQEDFGLVPVEAMAAGKPVIANAEGGVLESVIDWTKGKGCCTGVYFDPPTVGSLTLAINNFIDLEKKGYFDAKFIKKHAQKFSKDRFKREILKFVESKVKGHKPGCGALPPRMYAS